MQNARGGVFLFRLRGVTGAAADEYNLNVVDCNASVTVARRSSISVSGAQPPEANVKWFSVASPGPAGIFCVFSTRVTQFYIWWTLRARRVSLETMIEPGPAGNFFLLIKFPELSQRRRLSLRPVLC